MEVVLAPNRTSMILALARCTKGIEDGGDDENKPGYGSAEFECKNMLASVVFPGREWIDYDGVSSVDQRWRGGVIAWMRCLRVWMGSQGFGRNCALRLEEALKEAPLLCSFPSRASSIGAQKQGL